MSRFSLWLFVALLAGLMPAQAMTDGEEIELGVRVARDAEKQWGRALPPGDPRSERVRRIGSAFAQLSSRRSIPYSYKVLDNGRIMNAFAAPGGVHERTKFSSRYSRRRPFHRSGVRCAR